MVLQKSPTSLKVKTRAPKVLMGNSEHDIPRAFMVTVWGHKQDVLVHDVIRNNRGKYLVAFTLGKINKLVTLDYFLHNYLKFKAD